MQKIGLQTIKFDTPITILETASIVGPKEAEGPLAQYFDKCLQKTVILYMKQKLVVYPL